MVERVHSRDLEMVITAILIQRQVGGNLAEILDNISFTIRERIKLKGEIKTATAQGKISGTVVSLLPIFLTVIFFIINPEYISRLFTEPLGLGMLLMGVVMQIIGMIMIKKIISIEM
jgi:tight adherence protein B